MTAYEMSESKINILTEINYLEREIDGNNTGTVLLTNKEVKEIVNALKKCTGILDYALKCKG